MNFTFLHAADIHLDSPLRGLEAGAPADRIRGATRQALINLVDLALAEQVAFVLLAGDLFDGDWEDYPTGQFLVAQLGRLTRAGIPVYAISGNHDAQSVLTRRLPWPELARLFDTEAAHSHQVPGLDVVIHGQGFAHRAVTANLANDYPAPVGGMLNIGLLHTACGDGAHENYAPCTVDQLMGHGYDYWALGHVHARSELNAHPRWVVFPGNLQGRHINESGPKGATLVRVQAGRMTPEHRTLDVVRWARAKVDLAGVQTAEARGAAIRAALQDAADSAGGRLLATRVELCGATPLHGALARDPAATTEEVRAEIAGLGLQDQVWIERVAVHTRPVLALDDWRAGSDAAAALLRSIEAEPTPPVTGAVQEYAAHMLGKMAKLRETLGPDHPAVRAAAGDIPPELVERARHLVMSRLVEG